jgi:2-amino-4-hydroxy-6-hydroxymethyldihydropteridine diphosphokinase
MHTTYLSLGTNLGNRQHNLQEAIGRIEKRIGPVRAQSSFIETEPWGYDSPNRFLNAALCVQTVLSPLSLLQEIQHIERDMGRTTKTSPAPPGNPKALPHYQDRIIDIDILLYYTDSTATPSFTPPDWGGTLRLDSPVLTIPHPHICERDFVLIPLKEIL